MAKDVASGPVPVVVMGLGYIGREIVRASLLSPELELIGAVDSSEAVAGRSLADLVPGTAVKLKVARSLTEIKKPARPVVLLHATGSYLEEVLPELEAAARAGYSVVSTCEELAFPWFSDPDRADALDALAEKQQVSIVGTGVNPGFVLDRLVSVLGQACGPVERVHAERVVDARTRREALQQKVGAGLTEEQFFDLVDRGELGHVGLSESAALAALGLGISCDDFEEELFPVFAEEDIQVGSRVVRAGQVAGIHQVVIGREDDKERVRLELTMAVGAENPGDRIRIEANPKVEVEVRGGIAGDQATANLVVNAAARISAADPGLLTVLELPSGR